ncbi:hypothetical protein RJ639_001737 [Escallonia herrerae]|uniref:Pentatricopeptide repeat-containing protein n=1 Tax=Escallonia herrerae TaxID=1293975 RepID=A0AA88XP94_9ASTE|nr:hypothetical protein RJ639_001737 [Escallonia herrerae]
MSLLSRCSTLWSPSIVTLLRTCKTLKNLEQVHTQIIHKGSEQDHFLITQFICLCTAVSTNISYAASVFDRVIRPNIYLWNTLLKAHCKHSSVAQSISVFLRMKSSANVAPDEYTFPSLIKACASGLELAKWVDLYMTQSMFDLRRVHVAAALVDMNAKCGNMERATMLFEEMPKRDLISYCSMIQGLSIHGRGAQAVGLFARMLNEEVAPDDVAFTVILTACSHAGLVKEGCHYFDSMINDYSIVPSPDHYACMVDLLGRSGKLKAAYELIKSMPVEPHTGAWGALLGACNLHGDIELGKEIADRLFELEPLNAGNYVALSNIYAAADRWVDVSRDFSRLLKCTRLCTHFCFGSPEEIAMFADYKFHDVGSSSNIYMEEGKRIQFVIFNYQRILDYTSCISDTNTTPLGGRMLSEKAPPTSSGKLAEKLTLEVKFRKFFFLLFVLSSLGTSIAVEEEGMPVRIHHLCSVMCGCIQELAWA